MKLFARGDESPAQKAGALFALTNLNQLDFALHLLHPLWSAGQVDSSSAVWIVDRGLESGPEETQALAAFILRDCAQQLPDGKGGMHWPSSVATEAKTEEYEPLVRTALLTARLSALLSREFGYWRRYQLNSHILALKNIREGETEEHVRAGATLALEQLLKIHDPTKPMRIRTAEGPLPIEQLRSEVAKAAPEALQKSSTRLRSLAEDLGKWVSSEPEAASEFTAEIDAGSQPRSSADSAE